MRSGIVMNGPIPIMFVMLSAVASSKPKRPTNDGWVAPAGVIATHAVLLRDERFAPELVAKIEVVGAQADDLAAERFEGVAQQQQLAGGVEVCALATASVPGVANFDALDRRGDVVIA